MHNLLLFQLSDHLKFAIKVSLSLTMAYIIPMAMGWEQASTAAVTIMLIASAGGVSNSINKGLIRVVGTVIGAVLGMILIALFPQERIIYLGSMSLFIALFTYLYYAYQGDSTVFLLSSMMIMMIFANGVDDAFIYGIDRTFMTLFGILIYTAVGVFLWPVKEKKDTINDAPKGRMFIWLDPEYFKATIQLFCVFCFSIAFWIYFNPPAGFYVVILATLLGLITTFSPIKPSLLIILFTFGFIFATFSYIFILPNLVYGWELALFIFIYTFIAFYIINQKLTIFFLMGMFTLDIENVMNYNFDVFLMTLLVFYMFLIILMLFYHFPFSSRPEHLFTLMKERFLKHSSALIKLQESDSKRSLFDKIGEIYHSEHLRITIDKMKLWGSKIDTKYFNKNSPEAIMAFSSECEKYLHNTTDIQNCYTYMKKIDWENLKMNRF